MTPPSKPRRPPRLVRWLIVISIPVLLLVASVRLATGHWFVHWEYTKPDFPPDPYGLSTTERTYLANVCVDYLATGAPLSLLANLELPGGEFAFNARELRHMADVQAVYNGLMVAGLVAALIFVGGSVLLRIQGYPSVAVARAWASGGLLTLTLLLLIGGAMVFSWGDFFETFHRIFFEGDSWSFPHSDTLIRLFPMRFWIDVALVIVAPIFIGALFITLISRAWIARNLTPSKEV